MSKLAQAGGSNNASPGRAKRARAPARTRTARGALDRLVEARAALAREAREGALDERRVAPDQQHMRRVARDRLAQRREVLPLAVAAEDQHGALAEAAQRGDGGADVGALGIVVPLDCAAARHELEPVRQPAK